MYVLMCPCITDPSLRAKGITTGSDIDYFNRSIERCKTFGIKIHTLPCPETIYLGKNREPTNFLKSMNNSEFSSLLDSLEEQVRDFISENGRPLLIVGVDSSPSCGVDLTYYSDEKREGRGAFLSRFNDIPAVDVKEFADYRIYLAAPLFSEAERDFNLKLRDILEKNMFSVHLPQELDDSIDAREDERHRMIFEKNLEALKKADIVVGVIDGADADSGTAWEMGYAYASGKKIISLRTDFRKVGENELVNLMLEMSSKTVFCAEDIPGILKSPF
ncbi:nucleoside 2-deoxyribosyltransferase [Methanoplanus sp. FWC-SCC4]|uniref:Nucleoside 2-deoxyribosyltransferase n=2 Tax=Methanochimaera problematica TaxID=2609417 RepID=A0AA97I5E1_9EURY|nr:nucleoside 2-deoxyribosyltransferase [Methanoplanus sp. FWC-SCC4]